MNYRLKVPCPNWPDIHIVDLGRRASPLSAGVNPGFRGELRAKDDEIMLDDHFLGLSNALLEVHCT